jgi:hypothetical protein
MKEREHLGELGVNGIIEMETGWMGVGWIEVT